MKQIIIIVAFWIVSVFTCLSAIAQDKKQCTAKTKAGVQCMHKTATAFCKVHDPASPRCGAPTKSGGQCKMIVKVAGTKCHHHKVN